MTGERGILAMAGWGHTAASWEPLAGVLAGEGRELQGLSLPGMEGAGAATCRLEAAAESLGRPSGLLVGWSLGGLAAVEAVRTRAARPQGLILIGTPARFLAGPGAPGGMDPDQLSAFRESLAEDAPATLRRFYALQFLGDRAPRQAWAPAGLRERFLATGAEPGILAAWLDVLAGTDLTAEPPELEVPTLVIHGEADRIVPPAAVDFFRGCGPLVAGHTIPGAAHAPHISHPQATGSRIAEFARDLAG